MKDVKEKARYRYELADNLLFDYEAVEKHLEKMAAKGWRIDKINTNLWKYRKAEPAKVKYAVTYAPDASVFDPHPTMNQQTLADFCAQAGWVKVGDWSQAQVFVNERENPVPIETDEEIRLEVIKKSMKKSWIPANVMLILVMVFNAWRTISRFVKDPVQDLSSYWGLLTLTFMIVATALVSANLIGYFIWLRKSEKSVAAGGTCTSPRIIRQINRWSLPAAVIYFVAIIMAAAGEGAPGAAMYMILYMAGFLLMVTILSKTKDYLKSRGVSRGKNIAVFVVLDIILAFVMVGALTAFILSGPGLTADKDPYEPTVKGTFLAERTYGELADPEIGYEITEIKADWLYDWCFDKKINEKLGSMQMKHESLENPHIWGADAIYECWIHNRDYTYKWILVKDKYIVEIWGDDEIAENAVKGGGILDKLGI